MGKVDSSASAFWGPISAVGLHYFDHLPQNSRVFAVGVHFFGAPTASSEGKGPDERILGQRLWAVERGDKDGG
jgi:hypothetical protein